jgi:SAM-dependent methyltransferase
MNAIPTVMLPCPVCGSDDAEPRWRSPDRAFGVPGVFTVARCASCGLLYQRPRVRDDALAACYPDDYPRHQEPAPRVPLKGSASRQRAVRRALASGLGYRGLADVRASALERLRARLLLSRLRWSCPPWCGEGRYLDVGCGSGGSLGVARALGWRFVAGIEVDTDAAGKAGRFADVLHVGDVPSAPFEPGSFDLVTAFHVLEHLPDPVGAVRRMLTWLAPGGLVILEVPNAGGLGARLFGRAWSGLELPRHLWQFTPSTLDAVVRQAGGQTVWCRHQAKPRYYLRSLRAWLDDRGRGRLAQATERRLVYGVLKLALELSLPVVAGLRHGEVIRIGVAPAGSGRHADAC